LNIRLSSEGIDKAETGAIVLLLFKDEKPLKGACGLADWRMNGGISSFIMNGAICGESDELVLIDPGGRIKSEKILLVGMGKSSCFREDHLSRAARDATVQLVKIGIKKFVIAVPPARFTNLEARFASSAVLKGLLESKGHDDLDVTLTGEGVCTNRVLFTLEKLAREIPSYSRTVVTHESLSEPA